MILANILGKFLLVLFALGSQAGYNLDVSYVAEGKTGNFTLFPEVAGGNGQESDIYLIHQICGKLATQVFDSQISSSAHEAAESTKHSECLDLFSAVMESCQMRFGGYFSRFVTNSFFTQEFLDKIKYRFIGDIEMEMLRDGNIQMNMLWSVKYDLDLHFSKPEGLCIINVADGRQELLTHEYVSDLRLMHDICEKVRYKFSDSLPSIVSASKDYGACFELFSKLFHRYSVRVYGSLEHREPFSQALVALLNIRSHLQAGIVEVTTPQVAQALDYSSPVAKLDLRVCFGLEEQTTQINYPKHVGRDGGNVLDQQVNDLAVISSILNLVSSFCDFEHWSASLSLLRDLNLKGLEDDQYPEFETICSSFIKNDGLINLEINGSCLSPHLIELMRKIGVCLR